MLVLTRKVNQSIVIGDDIEVVVLEVRGEQIRLGIKAPRDVVTVDTIGRAPNGKVDYKRLKAHAADTLGR